MFSNNPTDSANHEVQKNTDGSISITNVNMLTTNWRDKDYVSFISFDHTYTYTYTYPYTYTYFFSNFDY